MPGLILEAVGNVVAQPAEVFAGEGVEYLAGQVEAHLGIVVRGSDEIGEQGLPDYPLRHSLAGAAVVLVAVEVSLVESFFDEPGRHSDDLGDFANPVGRTAGVQECGEVEFGSHSK